MHALWVIIGGLIYFLTAPAAAQDSFGDSPQATPDYGQQQQMQPKQGLQQGSTPSQPTFDAQEEQGSLEQTKLDQLAQIEKQDYGVQPVNALHQGPMHGPTPASIPGGQVITTKGLLELIQQRQIPFVLLDILGAAEVIPGAIPAVAAHQPGNFNDETQQAFGAFLQQVTGGNAETPIVLYCQSTYCWMSYNASLRAINLGYRNVLWYRGGIEAWRQGGQQTQAY